MKTKFNKTVRVGTIGVMIAAATSAYSACTPPSGTYVGGGGAGT